MYANRSTNQLFGRFISNAGLYGLAMLFTRLGWILLLPVYWIRLSPADYGLIGIAMLVQVFLNPVLGLGLHASVQRFYLEWSADERPRHVAALWCASILWGGAICLLLSWLGALFSKHLFTQVPFQPYLLIAIWTAFFTNIGLFPQAILRTREQVRKYSLIIIAAFLTQSAITLVFVLALDMGPEGYLAGLLLNAGLWACYFVYWMRTELAAGFGWRHLAQPLKFGLPTMPVTVLDGTASLFDRFFLDKAVPLAQLGIYNLGSQFGAAFNIFNQMMKASWFPFLYRVMAERGDTREILGRFAVYYLAILAAPALAVALLSKELLELFGDARFLGVYDLVPLFVLGYYIQSIAAALGRGLDLANRTLYWPLVSIVSIGTSLTALAFLVPRYGTVGAVSALILASTARVFVQVGLSVYVYPRPLHLGALARLALLVGGTFAAAYAVQLPPWFALVAKSLIILLGCALIAWFVAGREVCLSLLARARQALEK